MRIPGGLFIAAVCTLVAFPAFAAGGTSIGGDVTRREIRADYGTVKGPTNYFFRECIGAGRANEGLRADWQQQLAIAHRECGFKYIRMHGLLCDDMGVYREDGKGNPEYNFQYVDALYDFIVGIGMKPFVELGFMPSSLASGSQTIFWWKGNTTPPKDYAKWAALITALVSHLTERYGEAEVKTWYFEVWNEPNLSGFWAGSQAEYFKLYDYTARAIKKFNPSYRVGGPATAGAAWVPETIEHCKKDGVPIDFIATHAYGVNQGFLDEFGGSGTVLAPESDALSRDVLRSRREIAASSFPNLELHYTEWSSSYTPADPLHDSYHEAPYILEKLKQVGSAATSMSYWVFTDIFEEAAPRFTPFHGGFGLMNTQGIRKSAWWAYAYLNRLGGTELSNSDDRSFVCRSGDGVQVLLWDWTYTLSGHTNNQQYYIRDLPSAAKGTAAVRLSGLPAGRYRLDIRRIGYRANDAYTAYVDLGRPAQLTKKQVAELNAASSGNPEVSETVVIPATGEFTRDIPIRENDVCLLSLVRLP